MIREFHKFDIPYVDSGKFTLYDYKGNKGKLITWDNDCGDTEKCKIIVSFDGLPVGFDKSGYDRNIIDGEYFGTFLYVDDGTSDYRSSYDLEEELKSNNNEF